MDAIIQHISRLAKPVSLSQYVAMPARWPHVFLKQLTPPLPSPPPPDLEAFSNTKDFVYAGAVHVPVLLGLHGHHQQVPGPGGVRVRRHGLQDITGGAGRYIHVSTTCIYYIHAETQPSYIQ